MSRIVPPNREQVPEGSHEILDSFTKTIGRVPNLFRVLSLSPNALAGVVGLQRALSKTLNVRTRHQISLAVSQVSGCHYCLSAHVYTSGMSKMTPDEIHLARRGKATDPKEHAAADFARKVAETRGNVSSEDLEAVRGAGYSDAEIVEIIALSAQFMLTNFINNVFETEIDFPVVDAELPVL